MAIAGSNSAIIMTTKTTTPQAHRNPDRGRHWFGNNQRRRWSRFGQGSFSKSNWNCGNPPKVYLKLFGRRDSRCCVHDPRAQCEVRQHWRLLHQTGVSEEQVFAFQNSLERVPLDSGGGFLMLLSSMTTEQFVYALQQLIINGNGTGSLFQQGPGLITRSARLRGLAVWSC